MTGGAELYLQRLLSALVKKRHEIHLFTESWQGQTEGVVVHPVSVSGTRADLPLKFAKAVQRELIKESFDRVFSLERTLCQNVYRAGDGLHRVWLERRRTAASLWKKPFLFQTAFHRNMLSLEAQTFSPKNTGRVIVNSEMVKREILQHFDYPADRIHLVRNGVDTDRFQRGDRAGTRTLFGVKEDEFLLLFVGSGWERKGLGALMDILPELSGDRVKLLVVGKGRKPLRIPKNVIFAGPMSVTENAYAAADLFTFLPIYEPSANVCFEALASGLPVVTTLQNGAAEVILEGINGSIISRPNDRRSVIEAIQFWRDRGKVRPVKTAFDLSLERNVMETLAVLELATQP